MQLKKKYSDAEIITIRFDDVIITSNIITPEIPD